MIYPKEVVKELDALMTGQKNLKETLAVIFCRQYLRFQNKIIDKDFTTDRLLIIGESGTGKTHSLKCLNKILSNTLQFVWVNTTEFTGSGWHGKDLSSVISEVEIILNSQLENEINKKKIIEESFHNVFDEKSITISVINKLLKNIMNRIVFVFDEFDKIVSDKSENDGKSKGDLQNDFLKFIEDYPIYFKYNNTIYTLNLKDCVMVFLGVFEDLEKKIEKKSYSVGFNMSADSTTESVQNALVELGFRRELIARISLITKTNTLTTEELQKIISNHPYLQQVKIEFEAYGINLKIEEEFYSQVIDLIHKNKEGARGITRIFQEIFTSLFSEIDKLPKELTVNFTKIEKIQTELEYKEGKYIKKRRNYQ